jgi:hypothetical protein
MNASNQCYQLSMALYSILTRIPYEDAQIAATQLIQCATNILSVRYAFIMIKLFFNNNFRL